MTLDIGEINKKFNTTLQGMEDYLRQHINNRVQPLILDFRRKWELEILGDGEIISTGNNLYKTALRIKLTPYQTKTYILPVPKYWSCSVIASFNYGVVRLFDGHNSVELHSASEDNEICLCNQDVCFLQLENTTASDIYIDLYRIEISPILRFKTHPDKLVYNTTFEKLFYFEKLNRIIQINGRLHTYVEANNTFSYSFMLQRPNNTTANFISQNVTPTVNTLYKFEKSDLIQSTIWSYGKFGYSCSGIGTIKTIELLFENANTEFTGAANAGTFDASNTSTTAATYYLYASFARLSKIFKIVINVSTPSTGGSYEISVNGGTIDSGGAGVTKTITLENLDEIFKIQATLAGDGTNAATASGYYIAKQKGISL